MKWTGQFEHVEVWQAARVLVKDIYQVTRCGAFARDFGLRDQIQRAAVSVMSNIAEGFERGSKQELRRFLFISKASAGEVRSLLYVALDLSCINQATYDTLTKQVLSISRQLAGFIRHLDTAV